jgi:hypothetical protein
MYIDIVRCPVEGRAPGRGVRSTRRILENPGHCGRAELLEARDVGGWRSRGALGRHRTHIRPLRSAATSASFRSYWHATTSLAPSLTGRRRSFS